MSDTYTRVNWEDSPSTNTPISAENLNKMDKGIEDAHKKCTEISETINDLKEDGGVSGVGSSNKRLIGEITITNNTASVSDTTGIYYVVDDIQTEMLKVFSTLEQGFNMLVAEILIGDLLLFTPCTYSKGSDVLNVLQSINCDISVMTNLGLTSQFSFLKNSIRANDVSQDFVELILEGTVSMNVKFYVCFGSDLPNAEEASF